MKPRAYITRFGRIISNSDLPDKYKKNKEDCKEIDSPIGPVVRQFYTEILSVGLSAINHCGNMLLYPLRDIEVYVLTINGKSNFYSSNKKLYQTLFQKGFIAQTDYTKELFAEYRLLDLKEIAKHICNSQIEQVPVDDCFINGSDSFFSKCLEPPSFYSIIPCCFEEKVFIEAFLRTDSITDEILEKLKANQLREFTSCFNTPSYIYEELFEGLCI